MGKAQNAFFWYTRCRKFSKLDFNSLILLKSYLIGLKDKKSILNFGKAICPVLILNKNNLTDVAFDTETTGLNYRTDVILSIGAVEFMKTLLP
jgi:DNA polymerase III epsilon subunit-like protein